MNILKHGIHGLIRETLLTETPIDLTVECLECGSIHFVRHPVGYFMYDRITCLLCKAKYTRLPFETHFVQKTTDSPLDAVPFACVHPYMS